MNTFVALLRAVNVGGTGKLPMVELRAMCGELGFTDVDTYIASGNVVFRTPLPREAARSALEARLQAHAGKPVGVVMRTGDELAAVLRGNPFPQAAGNRLVILFFDEDLPADSLDAVRHRRDEQLHLARREIYIHYGSGMGQSKLAIPAAASGTGRNLNTVVRLLDMAAARSADAPQSRP